MTNAHSWILMKCTRVQCLTGFMPGLQPHLYIRCILVVLMSECIKLERGSVRRGFFRRAIRQFISRNALMSRNPAKGNSDGGVVDIIEIIFFFLDIIFYDLLRICGRHESEESEPVCIWKSLCWSELLDRLRDLRYIIL